MTPTFAQAAEAVLRGGLELDLAMLPQDSQMDSASKVSPKHRILEQPHHVTFPLTVW